MRKQRCAAKFVGSLVSRILAHALLVSKQMIEIEKPFKKKDSKVVVSRCGQKVELDKKSCGALHRFRYMFIT